MSSLIQVVETHLVTHNPPNELWEVTYIVVAAEDTPLACIHPHPIPHIGLTIHDYVASFPPVRGWLCSPAHERITVMVSTVCQLDRIWNHLGDTPLGISGNEYLD